MGEKLGQENGCAGFSLFLTLMQESVVCQRFRCLLRVVRGEVPFSWEAFLPTLAFFREEVGDDV